MAEELKGPVEVNDGSPFHPDNAPAVNLIVSMRIYDALMALLESTDHDMHERLNNLHESGRVGWSLPWIDLSEPSGDDSESTDDSVPPTSDGFNPDDQTVQE